MSCGRGYECSTTPGGRAKPGCGEHFRSLRGFDAHFAGHEDVSPICHTVEQIAALGYVKDPWGLWTEGSASGPARTGRWARRGGAETAADPEEAVG